MTMIMQKKEIERILNVKIFTEYEDFSIESEKFFRFEKYSGKVILDSENQNRYSNLDECPVGDNFSIEENYEEVDSEIIKKELSEILGKNIKDIVPGIDDNAIIYF